MLGFHEDTWEFPAPLSIVPEPLRLRTYRVWQHGKRSRFMTPTQLRHFFGLPVDGGLADMKINVGSNDFNWERIVGGASRDQLVAWNLRGARY